MTGLFETFNGLVELAKKSAKPEIVVPPQEPEGVYLLVTNGVAQRVSAAHPHFRGQTGNLGSLVALAATHKETAEVWYCDAGVKLVLRGRNRMVNSAALTGRECLEWATIMLSHSKAFGCLAKIDEANGAALTQKDLIRLLRTTLHGCAVRPASLLEHVRKVSFEHQKKQDSSVNQGRVSLGKEISSKLVTGAEQLSMETVSFSVYVFDNPTFTVKAEVCCDFDIDAEGEKFVITPLPGELYRAKVAGAAYIGDTLRIMLDEGDAKQVPIFYGWPAESLED